MSDNKNLIKDVHSAFDALKENVAKNLKSRDALTDEKIARIEAELATKSAQVDELALAAARGANEAKSDNGAAIRKSFDNGLRKGFERLPEIELKAMAVGDRNNADGGFLVPEAVNSVIQRKLFEVNVLRSLASIYTTGSNHLEFLQEGAETGAGWVTETAARPETTSPQVGSVTIPLFEIYAEPRVTRQLLEDNAFGLESYLVDRIGDKFGRMQATAFVKGNGTTAPKGILTSATSTTVSDANTVRAVTTGTVGALKADDIFNVMYDLETPYADGASWQMARLTMAAVRKFQDSTGQYLWAPSLVAGQPNTLLGAPVYQNEDLGTIATGNDVAIYGNVKTGYAIVDKPGAMIMIRDEYTDKQYIKFYTRTRVGGAVVRGEALRTLRIK